MNIKNSLAVFKPNNIIFHIIILFLFYTFSLFSAPITNLPITIKQPDGKVLNCFLSGDEFHNWVHDKDNYTIIRNEKTGFWTYAIKQNGSLTASEYIVGKDNPKLLNISPGINLNAEEIRLKREKILKLRYDKTLSKQNKITNITQSPITKGNFNNIAIFIRFQDDPEFSNNISYYDSLFNAGKRSIKNYYFEDSYGKLNLTTYFYPKSESFTNSYQDINTRGYYIKYNEVTNPNGYKDETERDERAERLFQRAISGVEDQIPADINFDQNNDGFIDNICFIIYGTAPGYSELLWPHYTEFDSKIIIKGKTAKGYSLVLNIENTLEDYLFNTTCHETGHAIGFPDLYRIYQSGDPVGRWDMMSRNVGFSGAWMKYKYAGWIDSIPETGREGQYTINAITNPHNNCYKIRSSVLTDEFLVIEYRKQDSLFERDIPGSGLLVTRINPNVNGNTLAPPDEIYYYRPSKEGIPDGDIMNAYFSSESGRTKLNLTTDPPLIFSDVNKPEIEIYDIGSSKEASTTFSVKRKNIISAEIKNKILPADSGNFSIDIKYLFPDQENYWNSSIISGNSWLHNTNNSRGNKNGQSYFSFDANFSDSIRRGIIRVSDTVALRSPINLSVYQSQLKSLAESEPNNSIGMANYITAGLIYQGKLSSLSDVDWYKFPALGGDQIEIIYSESNDIPNGGVEFYKNERTILQSIIIPEGRIIRHTITIPQTGIYYIRISSGINSKVFNYFVGITRSSYFGLVPRIINFSVSERDKSSVLANIKVSSSGLPATIKIEYGKSDKYGKVITFDNLFLEDDSLSDFHVSTLKKISDLEPSQKYHFRMSARNSMGIIYSDDREITLDPGKIIIPEIEPNQTIKQATQIYFGDSVCASIDSTNDIDFYKFYADKSDTLDVIYNEDANTEASNGILELWSDKDSREINGSQRLMGKIRLKYIFEEAGIYDISVESISGNNSRFGYSFKLNKFRNSIPSIDYVNAGAAGYNCALLNFCLLPNGLIPTLKVEYGTTKNYNKTYSFTLKETYQLTSPAFKITGLEANTTYHLRLSAKNDLGIISTDDKTITTSAKPAGIEILPYLPADNLNNISYTKNKNILVASMSGIFRSSDQGKSWIVCDSSITNINCLSTSNGINYLASGKGIFYRSSDGGNSWSRISKGNRTPSYLQCIDEKTAFIARSNSSIPESYNDIEMTTDGGVSWQSRGIIWHSLNSIYFIDKDKGFALGNKGMIFKTSDGGNSWKEQSLDSHYYLNYVYFTDSTTGFIAGSFDNPYPKKNLLLNPEQDPDSEQISTIQNSNVILSVSRVKTLSGGDTNLNESYSALILKTTNGGETWVRIPVSADYALKHIVFYDKNNGVSVGSSEMILITTDGGNNWIAKPNGVICSLNSACFSDQDNVFIGSSCGLILKVNLNSSPTFEKTRFTLSNNYPNPFNSQTNIEYSIPEDALVKIKIYDILGREVETILNENKKAGRYGISWEPKGLATGIYYYRIEAGKYHEARRLLYLK
jgi:M6 family metalloprotease-like protein